MFSGPRANYTVTAGTGANAGTITVTQTGANVVGQKVSDGMDTLRNIEAAEVRRSGTGGHRDSGGADHHERDRDQRHGGHGIGDGHVDAAAGGLPGRHEPADRRQLRRLRRPDDHRHRRDGHDPDDHGPGQRPSYTFQVRAVTPLGNGALSAPSAAVTPIGLAPVPHVGERRARKPAVPLSWIQATDGGTPIGGYQVRVRIAGVTQRTVTVSGSDRPVITG